MKTILLILMIIFIAAGIVSFILGIRTLRRRDKIYEGGNGKSIE